MKAANDKIQSQINGYLLAASKSSLWKIEKDSEILLQLPDSDERIQTSNRFYFIILISLLNHSNRLEEGVFSRWKKFEALYNTMTNDKIESLTRAVTNKVYKINYI